MTVLIIARYLRQSRICDRSSGMMNVSKQERTGGILWLRWWIFAFHNNRVFPDHSNYFRSGNILHRPARQKYEESFHCEHLEWKRSTEVQRDVLWNFLSLEFFSHSSPSPQIWKYAHVEAAWRLSPSTRHLEELRPLWVHNIRAVTYYINSHGHQWKALWEIVSIGQSITYQSCRTSHTWPYTKK